MSYARFLSRQNHLANRKLIQGCKILGLCFGLAALGAAEDHTNAVNNFSSLATGKPVNAQSFTAQLIDSTAEATINKAVELSAYIPKFAP